MGRTWDLGTSVIIAVEEIHDTWGQIVYANGDNSRYIYLPVMGGLKRKSSPVPNPKFNLVLLFIIGKGISLGVIDSDTLKELCYSKINLGISIAEVIMKRTN